MINIFDRTLKIIARNHAETFLHLAFPNQAVRLVGTIQNVEISLPVQPVDFVHKVIYHGQEYIFHLEFQLKHSPEIPQRTFITAAELTAQFKLPVLTVLLYLQPRKAKSPNTYQTRLDKTVVNEFSYPVIQLWDYVTEIRQGKYRELAPLLMMLVESADESVLAEERALILQEEDIAKRADLMAAAVAVASRHFKSEYLWLFFKEEIEMLKQVSFIEEWIEEGERRGRLEGRAEGILHGIEKGRIEGIQHGMEKGRIEGIQHGIQQGELQNARDAVLDVLMLRFGKLPKQSTHRMNGLVDLIVLKALHRKAVMADTLADFDEFMLDLVDNLSDEDG